MFNQSNVHYNRSAKGVSLPGKDDLVGGYLVNKPPQDYTVLDERPGVVRDRPVEQGRGLQFDNSAGIRVEGLQVHTANAGFKIEFEFVYSGSKGYLFDCRDSDGVPLTDGVYCQIIADQLSVGGAGVVTSPTPLVNDVRYTGFVEYTDKLRLEITADGGVTEVVESAVTPLLESGTNFHIGCRYDLTSPSDDLIGWMRITKDSVYTAEWAFEDKAGVTVRDRSGNDNHGIISNSLDISAMHVTDNRITNGGQGSFLNQLGYTLDGSVKVPRLVNANTDVLGNPLTYSKEVAQDLTMVNSNCATFDKSTEYILLPESISTVPYTCVYFVYFDSALAGGTSTRELFSGSSDLNYVRSDRFQLRTNGTLTTYSYNEGTIADEDMLDKWLVFIDRREADGSLYRNFGGIIRTATEDATTQSFELEFLRFGFRFQTGLNGRVARAALYSRALSDDEVNAIIDNNAYTLPSDAEYDYIFSNGNGSVIFDISGNERLGTISDAMISDVWANTQDEFHWNIKKGFNAMTEFDGATNAVQGYGSQGFSNINTQFRFRSVFYYDASDSGEHYILNNVDNTSGDTGDVFIAAFENHTLFLGFRDASARIWTNEVFTDVLDAGVYYIDALYDGAGNWTATINGEIFSNTGGWSIGSPGGGHAIGKRSLSTDRYFTGAIKYIEIYNASDVLAHRWSHEGNFVDEIGGLVNISATLGDELKIPYAPTGDTLSNPAGKWHNGAETDLNAPESPEMVNHNNLFSTGFWFDASYVVKDVSYDDIVANYEDADVLFADVSVDNQKKRLLAYDSVQVNPELAKIEKFTNQ